MQLVNDIVKFNVLGMDADGYDAYAAVNVRCSFFRSDTSGMSDKGLKPDYKAVIRIPEENVPKALVLTKGMTIEHGTERMTVVGWTDNRKAPYAPHIKVVCA